MCALAVPTAEDRSDLPAALGRVKQPLIVLGGLAVATAFVGLVSPDTPGHYPVCPFKALTGLDCPFCGGLRSVHALVRGHVLRAADHNLLFVLSVPFLATAWIVWLVTAAHGKAFPWRPNRAWWMVGIGVLAVFMIVRNIPGMPFLGSS